MFWIPQPFSCSKQMVVTIPTIDSLVSFVQTRLKILLNMQSINNTEIQFNQVSKPFSLKFALTVTSISTSKPKKPSRSSKSYKPKPCVIFNRGEHAPYHYSVFNSYYIPRHREYVRTNKLGLSCINPTHIVNACTS